MAGTLWVVATPIGNLDDLSRRAARVLQEAGLVVAEDTRRTQKLLSHLGLSKKLRRLDANASERDVESVVEELASGIDVALCTDAGTPGVSDPGAVLVARARERGLSVVPIPGPSAVVTALSASGYAARAFRFVGFLPRTGLERTRAIASLASDRDVVILFEAPQRLGATLVELASSMATRPATIARELTKVHEEISSGSLETLATTWRDKEVMGEITLVLGPWEPVVEVLTHAQIEQKIDAALASGLRARDAAEQVALETGLSKKQVYAMVVERKQRRGS